MIDSDEPPHRLSLAVIVLGVIDLPILLTGVLTLNVPLCAGGAVISAVAALLHVALLFVGL